MRDQDNSNSPTEPPSQSTSLSEEPPPLNTVATLTQDRSSALILLDVAISPIPITTLEFKNRKCIALNITIYIKEILHFGAEIIRRIGHYKNVIKLSSEPAGLGEIYDVMFVGRTS